MLFKKIELTNIGPYEGNNTFHFDTDQIKNTVLIGGKNGSGKTTFLNGVKIALYGPLAYGYRTHTNAYLSEIETMLNNKAKNSNKDYFEIKLGFTMVDDFKRSYIEIIRSWSISNSTLKENVEIYKNDFKLNEIEKDNFLEKLRVTLPPSLLELCFFDGEDITKLSNEDNLSLYLSELSSKLFNLDLFQSLESNLKKYLTEDTKSNKEKRLEEEKVKIEQELNEKVEQLYQLQNRIEKLLEQLKTTKFNYQKTREEFSIHGGLLYEEREEIQREILQIEHDRKQVNEQIKEFIAKELPFFLAYPMLSQLVQQLESEENYYISSIIEEKLKTISIEKLEKALNISIDVDKKNALHDTLLTELTVQDNVSIIHNASKTETSQVHGLASSINAERLKNINQLINQNNEDLKRLSKLQNRLKDNQQTSEFNEMIASMERDTKIISEIESELESIQNTENVLQEEIKIIKKQHEKIKKELHNIYKKKSSFGVTEKVLNISKKFQKEQLRRKISDVEYFSTKMIKNLMRKANFIERIHIDPETFRVYLLDEDNNLINKEILSAGEKELLVLSIIWGTIHSSNKEIPIVLDTLLGRLDIDHKSSVINKLIPQFGKQCIILATDSEITHDLFVNLTPFVSNAYTLNYDTKEKRTNIEKNFFNRYIEGETLHEL